MTSTADKNLSPPDARTLFSIYDPQTLQREVEEAEREVIQELAAKPLGLRTGIGRLEYLADQLRFFKAALAQAARRGLTGLAQLEWAEYLSWPESIRQARPGWKRDLLRRYAFEKPATLWQAALAAHAADDAVGIGPPRNSGVWPPPILQFGPYPSEHHPTAKAPVCLRAHISFDPWTEPGPLLPVRRLNRATVWTLEMSGAWLYDGRWRAIEILIDEPRNYSAADAKNFLETLASELEAKLPVAETVEPQISAAVIGWRTQIAAIHAGANELNSPKTRDRARALEQLTLVPGTIRFGSVEILPDDLPDEWFEVFLGFSLARKGLLSVREQKKLREAAAALLMHWQASKYEHRELVERLAAQIVERLGTLRRLLGAKSLFAYIAKAVVGSRRRP